MHEAFDIIENTARNTSVSKLLWPNNDEICKFMNIEDFKKVFASKTRSPKIFLSNATEKIGNHWREKQFELLREFHVDTLTQTHYAPRKTSTEIMNKYHWARINRDAIRSARNCTECKLQRGELTLPQATSDE